MERINRSGAIMYKNGYRKPNGIVGSITNQHPISMNYEELSNLDDRFDVLYKENNDFCGADFNYVIFGKYNPNGYNIVLIAIDFSDASMINVCMGNANLEDAIFIRADLRNADLCYSNLNGADFRDADLRNAYLCYADLRNVNLKNADLRGANLEAADLRGANLEAADLRGVIINGNTKLSPEHIPLFLKANPGMIINPQFLLSDIDGVNQFFKEKSSFVFR